MTHDLRERMHALADQAPTGRPPAGLWEVGVRRHRRQRAGAVLATLLVVALAGGGALLLRAPVQPQPAGTTPVAEGHLPRAVHAPDPWSQGVDELGPPGRLAVLAGGKRYERDGLLGKRQRLSWYGVPADGSSPRFLDLPATEEEIGRAVLSPDGTKVGYERYEAGAKPDEPVLTGWAVYDTVTGKTVEIEDAKAPRPTGGEAFDFAFTGDSAYLLTAYSRTRPATNRSDELVAWDVRTGTPVFVEEPGRYWLPNLGSAPRDVVWSRGSTTYRYQVSNAAVSTYEVPEEVVQFSFARTGRATAYVGHEKVGADEPATWRLFVQASDEYVEAPLPEEPGTILGWRDARTVVVSPQLQGPLTAYLVDVRTGEVVDTVRTRVPRETFPGAFYAAELWVNDLVPGAQADDVQDPRLLPIGGLVLGAAVLLGVVVSWSRRVRP